jgi:hypothetical protein
LGATRIDGTIEYWVHALELHITRLERIAAAHNLDVWPSPGLEHVEIVADNEPAIVSMLAMRGPAGAAGSGGQCGTREPNARVVIRA